jgi:septum formation protein
MPFVLASASPRRRELLAAAGIDVTIDPVDVDETQFAGESPAAYVERVARLKAAAGARRHPRDTVIAADTAVVLGDEVLGKPIDAADAARMLRRLSGRDHEVLTGVAVASRGRTQAFVERSVVTFAALSAGDVAEYVATGEPFDKAGAYAIQGGASGFVTALQGSFSNVVGLPMERLLQLIEKMGQ